MNQRTRLVLFALTLFILSPVALAQIIKFPEDADVIYENWDAMTDLRKKNYLAGFKGNLLSGNGKVISVEDGGNLFGCANSRYTKIFGLLPDCYKVAVMRLAPNCPSGGLEIFGLKPDGMKKCAKLHLANLYFSKKDKRNLLLLKKGQKINFANCRVVQISNGFYAEFYCDANIDQIKY